jgi:His-Xaa-Ser system radical SAM maturase HxsC
VAAREIGMTTLALHRHARSSPAIVSGLYRVVSDWLDIVGNDRRCVQVLRQYAQADGYALETAEGLVVLAAHPEPFLDNSVIRLRAGGTLVSVLYRPSSSSNALFLTERCNSKCLMCSQPPRDDDDSWRVAEILELIELIDPQEPMLGMTGGEATLLGYDLCRILDACQTFLPNTKLHILTNGRLFEDPVMAEAWVNAGGDNTTWAVPVYGPDALLHDYVVDSKTAFDQTMRGLYELAKLGARVEIRVVLVKPVTERLEELAEFLWRRLPFAEHIALMGLEPMGYAKRNRALVYIDPAEYADTLAKATYFLANRGLRVSIFNIPLCVLPRAVWPFARKSISDWKNIYVAQCDGCAVKEFCGGFFASEGDAWRSKAVRSISLEELAQ